MNENTCLVLITGIGNFYAIYFIFIFVTLTTDEDNAFAEIFLVIVDNHLFKRVIYIYFTHTFYFTMFILEKIYIFYKVTKKYKIARRKGNCTLHNNQRFVFDPEAGVREIC